MSLYCTYVSRCTFLAMFVCVYVELVHADCIVPQCQYTAEGPSELCKKESHSLVRFKATKRFFECKDCKRRSVTYNETLPTKACTLVSINFTTKVAHVALLSGWALWHYSALWHSTCYPNDSTVSDEVGCGFTTWYKSVGMTTLYGKAICGMPLLRIVSVARHGLCSYTEFLSIMYMDGKQTSLLHNYLCDISCTWRMGYCVPFFYLPQPLWWNEFSEDWNDEG